jgi:hypothetical protein
MARGISDVEALTTALQGVSETQRETVDAKDADIKSSVSERRPRRRKRVPAEDLAGRAVSTPAPAPSPSARGRSSP